VSSRLPPNKILTHHAYLLIGSRETSERKLFELCQTEGLKLVGSPDYFVFKEALFGVDDARTLTEQAITKAFTEKKVFFIAPEKITFEAQNALLKTFEEPIAHTHFFLATRDEHLILPTLRSRMEIIYVKHSVFNKEAQQFLSLPPKERLGFVKKFVDKEENLSIFLDALLLELRKGISPREALGKVFQLRLSSDDRGASPRLILEHLAMVLS